MQTALISYTWGRIHWGYDAVYDKTITLFNRYSSRLGDTWYPTVIHNVQLIADKSAIIAQYGAESSDKALLHIRYETVDGMPVIAGKPYKTPKEWDRQTNDLLSQTLTFTDGQYFDFFMLGEYESDDGKTSQNQQRKTELISRVEEIVLEVLSETVDIECITHG